MFSLKWVKFSEAEFYIYAIYVYINDISGWALKCENPTAFFILYSALIVIEKG